MQSVPITTDVVSSNTFTGLGYEFHDGCLIKHMNCLYLSRTSGFTIWIFWQSPCCSSFWLSVLCFLFCFCLRSVSSVQCYPHFWRLAILRYTFGFPYHLFSHNPRSYHNLEMSEWNCYHKMLNYLSNDTCGNNECCHQFLWLNDNTIKPSHDVTSIKKTTFYCPVI